MTTSITKSTRNRRKQPKASVSRINEKERQMKALELRKQGKDFHTIAIELGYSDRSGAYRAVMAVLNELPRADADALRAEQSARLDAIVEKMWPKLPDASAANSIIRAEERRARLMGIDLDPKAAEMLQAALASATANAQANVFIINGEKKRPEDLTFEELDIVEAHLAGDDVGDATSS